ncbi:MAG: hypothetical protein KGI98_15585 [Euryarchaeota archaeon]|nr:hypothetical protein [Euryarchaeota archaeon]
MTGEQTWAGVDIDPKRTGLPCRGGCAKVFYPERPASDKARVAAILTAGRMRDFHERELHSYHHVIPEVSERKWNDRAKVKKASSSA